MHHPDHKSVFVQLQWHGPYRIAAGREIRPAPEAELGSQAVPDRLPDTGVYMIVGNHHVHGPRSLLYIGQSIELAKRRLPSHASWLENEWRPEIFAAAVKEDLVRAVESLLIYAHSPAYCAREVSKLGEAVPDEGLRIWNTGSFTRLLPEVSSVHPWYRNV